MKDRKLASRYAQALLSVLTDPTAAASADRFLDALARSMQESPETRDLLLDPAISRKARTAALRELCAEKGQPHEMGNFFATLIDHRRMAALPTIAQVYHEERETALGIVPAHITTAEPLSTDLQARARDTLQKLTGCDVRLDCQVDPQVLGGAVTRIGSTVYDGSLRTQLRQLRRDMIQE